MAFFFGIRQVSIVWAKKDLIQPTGSQSRIQDKVSGLIIHTLFWSAASNDSLKNAEVMRPLITVSSLSRLLFFMGRSCINV
ncbi:unnamed protein product [Brassica rapa subsp. trilocularis]